MAGTIVATASGMDELVLLYDGDCGLCAKVTQFVLPRDTKNRFRFAPLQGTFAGGVLPKHGKRAADLDTFYVVIDAGKASERVLDRADAALRVLSELGLPWSLAKIFRLVPRFLRNAVYDFVARNRYAWFGHADACALPKPEWRAKFID